MRSEEESSVPIHNLGYRGWDGKRTPDRTRWWVLADSGLKAAWKSRWVRRLLFAAWLPVLFWGLLIFLYEQRVQEFQRFQQLSPSQIDNLPWDIPRDLFYAVLNDPEAARPEAWSFLIMNFIRTTQAVGLMVLVGLIAPPLIARDMRSRAFLLYFARPITRFEYMFGKSFTVWAFITMITLVPSMMLYVEAVLLSNSFDVVRNTWVVPLRIVGASLLMIVPTTAVALCASAMTRESRFASFAWFSFWILGFVSYEILFQLGHPRSIVSPFHSLAEIQRWIFGFCELAHDLTACVTFWTLVTPLAWWVTYRKISAPMNV